MVAYQWLFMTNYDAYFCSVGISDQNSKHSDPINGKGHALKMGFCLAMPGKLRNPKRKGGW